MLRNKYQHILETISKTKGWWFEAPSLGRYEGLWPAIWSIWQRFFIGANLVLLLFETVFYPLDEWDVLLLKKVN